MNAFNSKIYRRDALLLTMSFVLIYTLIPIAGSIDLTLMQHWAYLFLFVSLICGILMSLGQMMRGAHFLSHNLWTAWIIYLFNTLFLLTCFKGLEFKRRITHNT